jgi:membrane-bound serine protease (ClpP class)
LLVDSPIGFPRISLSVLIPVSLATAAIAAFLLGNVVRSSRSLVRTGSEAMLRESAVAQEDFRPHGMQYEGSVRIHGEIWAARCPEPVTEDERVKVLGRDGLILLVQSLRPMEADSKNHQEPRKRIA